jgi:hypothetical protein
MALLQDQILEEIYRCLCCRLKLYRRRCFCRKFWLFVTDLRKCETYDRSLSRQKKKRDQASSFMLHLPSFFTLQNSFFFKDHSDQSQPNDQDHQVTTLGGFQPSRPRRDKHESIKFETDPMKSPTSHFSTFTLSATIPSS